jgi:hypothetical protein
MKQYKTIQDIKFAPCIEIFNDANNIVLFFTKKTKSKRKTEQVSNNKTQKKVQFAPAVKVTKESRPNNKTTKNRT